jgi:hypothetical protein
MTSAAGRLFAGVFFVTGMLVATRSARADVSRVEADPLWYLRLGAGAVSQTSLSGGPAFGFGLRYGLEHIAFDGSLFNFILTKQNATFDNITGSWIKLGVAYYIAPRANASFYGGVGLGWGVTSATVNAVHYGSSGLDVGLSLGYELMRDRSFRLFVQADADLPAYASHGYVPTQSGFNVVLVRDSIYTPSFALSLGIGFARPKKPVVE